MSWDEGPTSWVEQSRAGLKFLQRITIALEQQAKCMQEKASPAKPQIPVVIAHSLLGEALASLEAGDPGHPSVTTTTLKEIARLARLGSLADRKRTTPSAILANAIMELPPDTAIANAGPNGDDEGGWWVLRCTPEGWEHWKACNTAMGAVLEAHRVPKQ